MRYRVPISLAFVELSQPIILYIVDYLINPLTNINKAMYSLKHINYYIKNYYKIKMLYAQQFQTKQLCYAATCKYIYPLLTEHKPSPFICS